MKNPTVEERLIHYIESKSSSNSLYWFPLVQVEESLYVAAYDTWGIYQSNYIILLENIMKACNIEHVVFFQMDHRECFENENIVQLLYEQDEYGYIFPWYSETFLFDQSEKWLIYLSHEHTISFTGKEIVTAAKQIIPPRFLIA